MTTEDEVMRLLRRADPDRGRADVPSVDGSEYLAALRTRSSNVDYIVTEPTPTERPTNRHRWLAAAAAATVAVIAGGLVLAARDDDETQGATAPASVTEGPVTTPQPETTQPPEIPLAENGLIAFAGSSAESGYEIYVVAPDGTGLRALTSTPDEREIAPAWSPDGTRLAFLRNVRPSFSASGELVVIDAATGVETFSADIPMERISDLYGRVRWSPDGRRVALNLANSSTPTLIVDVETNTWTTISSGHLVGWSPDGKWFVLHGGSETMLLVPTVLLDTTNLVVDSNVFGVRPLPVRSDLVGYAESASWMPHSSAVAITLDDGSVQVVTIADGQYRTLIEDGGPTSWSPDGRQLAYATVADGYCLDEVPHEVWVAAADGTVARAVTTSRMAPIWSPDGSLLLGAGPDGLFTVRPDGTGMTIVTPTKPRLANPDGCHGPPSFIVPRLAAAAHPPPTPARQPRPRPRTSSRHTHDTLNTTLKGEDHVSTRFSRLLAVGACSPMLTSLAIADTTAATSTTEPDSQPVESTGVDSEDAPHPPVAVSACISPGPEVYPGTEEQVVVSLPDGEMMIDQRRGITWSPTLTSVTDPRLEGTMYQADNSDAYTLTGNETGHEFGVTTNRIENDEGAWQGSAVRLVLPDGTTHDAPLVTTGEGAYEGLTEIVAIVDSAGGDCTIEGYVIDGAIPPAPVPQTGQ